MVNTVRQLGLPLAATAKAKLPTNLTTNKYPVHRWMNFIAGFSPEFVSNCIQNSNTKKNFQLIDPFAGLSTSLVQANLEGLPSVGFEVHPFFIDISQAKLGTYTTKEIHELLSIAAKLKPYKGNLLEIWSDNAVGFLEKLIPETALRELAGMAAALRGIDALVFTGGIGENAVALRERIVDGAAAMALFLASDKAAFVSGQAVAVDGGFLAS